MPDEKLCHAADFFGNDLQMGDPVSLSTRVLAGSDSQAPHVRAVVDAAFSF